MGKSSSSFVVAESGRPAGIILSDGDHPGALRVARLFAADLAALCGAAPALSIGGGLAGGGPAAAKRAIVIGTLGRGGIVDALADAGFVDASAVRGGSERYLRRVVSGPLPGPLAGADEALVIAGSDKRGTIYGMLDLSARLGVSPWSWWADVPIPRCPNLALEDPDFVSRSPAVFWRGIFLNDEEPCLGRWAREKFGGLNAAFYEKVLELVLRLGGNFLWPAMWGKSFFEDDGASPGLADELGVVIGTSHHEPMCRAHDEWRRHGSGPWSYEANAETLRSFWREGYARAAGREVVATVGMRGDGDEPMSEAENIALLERIVRDQREIIREVSGAAPEEQPQAWAVYKEVQRYYDLGMRVPDDATIVLADDNWGNVRRLPPSSGASRAGGWGMYYHVDYVGGPRCYKWLPTSQDSRIWEQMRLCYGAGIDRLWVINVGDLKPCEYSIDFFLSLARDADRMDERELEEFPRAWAARQFGPERATEIAAIVSEYERLASRRKPELLSAHTYSLAHFREAERVEAEHTALLERAERVGASLGREFASAYLELALHPVRALANVHAMYFALARNALYAAQGRASANEQAALAEESFRRDADLSRAYNEELEGGKWRHMMDQTHIGYTYWRDPEYDVLPATASVRVGEGASMGVAVEGSAAGWPGGEGSPALPPLDPFAGRERRIEVFNRGREPFSFRAVPSEAWIIVEPSEGEVGEDARLSVKVDWDRAPSGASGASVRISGSEGTVVEVAVTVQNLALPRPVGGGGFVEGDGCVAIEAEHYSRAVGGGGLSWTLVPRLGRTLSAMTVFPAPAGAGAAAAGEGGAGAAAAERGGGAAPILEYSIWLHRSCEVEVEIFSSPPQDLFKTGGPRYSVAFDSSDPAELRLGGESEGEEWERTVSDNARRTLTRHGPLRPGWHALRYRALDPALPLQRIVVWTGPRRDSYLGPPESLFVAGG
jgi:hypothetical protein